MEWRLPINPERVAVIIGKGGEVKKRIEALTRTEIDVDTKQGVIRIRGESLDDVMTASNIIKAVE